MADNKNTPAFPGIFYEQSGTGPGMYTSDPGFTKMELAAFLCLQGLLAGNPAIDLEWASSRAQIAADTLFDHLAKTE